MEDLVKNLIKRLQERKIKEYDRIAQHNDDREIVMMSSGKILEIENIINDLEEMLRYYKKTTGYTI